MRSRKHAVTLLIDADVIAYKHATAAQHVYSWEPGVESVETDDIEQVWAEVVAEIANLIAKLKATAAILCLTDDVNFRKALLPAYKATRRVKPILLPEIRARMVKELDAKQKPGLEGDDVMGILATHPKLIKGSKVIVSIDKDMRQIPGTLYRKGEFTEVSVEEADYFHMMQTLTGDPVDEYKGCPGIGPVKAAQILGSCSDLPKMWNAIVETYTMRGLTEADALVQARCARILRYTDYDFQRKEPRLWLPPGT